MNFQSKKHHVTLYVIAIDFELIHTLETYELSVHLSIENSNIPLNFFTWIGTFICNLVKLTDYLRVTVFFTVPMSKPLDRYSHFKWICAHFFLVFEQRTRNARSSNMALRGLDKSQQGSVIETLPRPNYLDTISLSSIENFPTIMSVVLQCLIAVLCVID